MVISTYNALWKSNFTTSKQRLTMTQMSNLRIKSEKDVISPHQLQKEIPSTEPARLTVSKARNELVNILEGRNQRVVVMVGPCSIHDVDAALEYAGRLRKLADFVKDTTLIVMRVYFEKPRTTTGWKGLIVDPHRDGSNDFNEGLRIARKLLVTVSEMGLPIVTEFLGPIVPQFIGDLITTGTVGARTIESQTHREMASGLSMPIGYKNDTHGETKNALDAYVASCAEHTFLGIDEVGQLKLLETTGNPHGYIILRGGNGVTNYDPAKVDAVIADITKRNLKCPIVVDCSHGNSEKKAQNQDAAFKSVSRQIVAGKRQVIGMMVESNLLPGRQDYVKGRPLEYGVSITDECIGWAQTEVMIITQHLLFLNQRRA